MFFWAPEACARPAYGARTTAPSPQLMVMLGRGALFSEPLSIEISSRTVRTD